VLLVVNRPPPSIPDFELPDLSVGPGSRVIKRLSTRSYAGPYYPEVVLLHVLRSVDPEMGDAALGINLSEIHGHNHHRDGHGHSFVVVKDLTEGPCIRAGFKEGDVILTLQDNHIHCIEDFVKNESGQSEFDVVVKRMARLDQPKAYRQYKVEKKIIKIDPTIGLGINLHEIQSGLGTQASEIFLLVMGFKEPGDGTVSPGLAGGLRQFDLILQADGQKVNHVQDILNIMAGNDEVELTVRRMVREYGTDHPYNPDRHKNDTKEYTVPIHRPEGSSFGVTFAEAYKIGTNEPFVVVQSLRPEGLAAKANMAEHDVIWKVDDVEVFSIGQIKDCVSGKSDLEFIIRRYDFSNWDDNEDSKGGIHHKM